MKIAMCQINTKVGDFQGNTEKIIQYAEKALSLKADIAVFPELSICGYPPLDLLDQKLFFEKNNEFLQKLQKQIPHNIAVAVGHVSLNSALQGKPYFNSISVIKDGQIIFTGAKTLLSSYDVFDESRYFQPAPEQNVFQLDGIKIGIAICEDMWFESNVGKQQRYDKDPVLTLLDKGAQLILAPSAAPFFAGKREARFELLQRIGKTKAVPVIYVNSVGGNDSLIFDGNSMATDRKGNLVLAGKSFEEDILLFDTEKTYPELSFEENYYSDIENALVLGLKDYLAKCGFKKVHLGISGGIDSALVAYIAVKAIGSDNVKGFAMPSHFSSEESMSDAKKLAENLGIELGVILIKPMYDAFLNQLEPFFAGRTFDVTEENLQARIRGNLMMAYSNKWGSLLLTTGNKSELSTGYCTMYGDMAGGICVIGDLFKTDVFSLCKYINRNKEIIPETTISKPPSAELRPDQKDEDSLPPYSVLDEILSLYIIKNLSIEDIVAKGFDKELVSSIISLVARAEYKRVQAAPVLKISPRAFGIGRRVPLAREIYEI